MPNAVAIDWSTAEVRDFDGVFALVVELRGGLDEVWREAFNDIREDFNRSASRQKDGDLSIDPIANEWLNANYLRVGAESGIKDELNILVDQANQNAERDRAALEQQTAEAARRAEQAKEMTRRFRGE